MNCGVKSWKQQRSCRGTLHDDDDDAVVVQAEATRQRAEIGRLQTELSRLDDVRQQQQTSIEQLNATVDRTGEEQSRRRDQASHTIHALTSELRTTKQALDDTAKRERQVLLLPHVYY